MGIRARRGQWHYRFRHVNQDYSGSTGLAATTQNKRKAQLVMEERRREIREQGRPPREKPFSEAAREFLEWCEAVEYRAHPNTARRIATSMASLTAFFVGRPSSLITPGDVEQYKSWRIREHGIRDVTLRHDLDALSIFFGRWAMKFGWAKSNPVKEVKRPSDIESIRMHVVTTAEELTYFEAAHKNQNLYDLARLVLLQGARPGELLTLQPADVDLERATLSIRGGKSRAARRTLDLVPESLGILARRLQNAGKWVFPSDRRPGEHLVKLDGQHDQACREAGVSFCIYDLRHSFATRMCEAGCDLATLAAILGHSGLRMVMRYVHPTAEHKREAMRRYQATLAMVGRPEAIQ